MKACLYLFLCMSECMIRTEASKARAHSWTVACSGLEPHWIFFLFFFAFESDKSAVVILMQNWAAGKSHFFLVLLWPKESILFLCEPYWAGLGAVWSWFALMVRGPDEKWWKERSCFEEFCTCKCCWSLEHCGLWPIELGVCKSWFAPSSSSISTCKILQSNWWCLL